MIKIAIFFLHNKNTNFDHGISTIEMYLLTFVVTLDLQFMVGIASSDLGILIDFSWSWGGFT